jgi:hypothetical protein
MIMRKSAGTLSPVITIDRRAQKTLHRQVYDGFREGILERFDRFSSEQVARGFIQGADHWFRREEE